MYLPATLPLLARWLAAGAVGAAGEAAYAVTPELREWYAEGDTEEMEYVAQLAAARESLRLLAADPSAPRRRVVVAVDTDGVAVSHAEARGAVRLREPLPWRAVAAGLVDGDDAVPVVTAAADAVAAADLGDDEASFVADGAEDHELGWYAVGELGQL